MDESRKRNNSVQEREKPELDSLVPVVPERKTNWRGVVSKILKAIAPLTEAPKKAIALISADLAIRQAVRVTNPLDKDAILPFYKRFFQGAARVFSDMSRSLQSNAASLSLAAAAAIAALLTGGGTAVALGVAGLIGAGAKSLKEAVVAYRNTKLARENVALTTKATLQSTQDVIAKLDPRLKDFKYRLQQSPEPQVVKSSKVDTVLDAVGVATDVASATIGVVMNPLKGGLDAAKLVTSKIGDAIAPKEPGLKEWVDNEKKKQGNFSNITESEQDNREFRIHVEALKATAAEISGKQDMSKEQINKIFEAKKQIAREADVGRGIQADSSLKTAAHVVKDFVMPSVPKIKEHSGLVKGARAEQVVQSKAQVLQTRSRSVSVGDNVNQISLAEFKKPDAVKVEAQKHAQQVNLQLQRVLRSEGKTLPLIQNGSNPRGSWKGGGRS